MNFGEKKNIIIAGGIIVVAIVLLAVVLLGGKKKSPKWMNNAGGTGGAASTASTRAGGGAAATGGGRAATTTALATGAAGTTPGGALPPTPGQTTPAGGLSPITPAPPGSRMWNAILAGSNEISATTRPDPLLFLEPPPRKITPEELLRLEPVALQEGGLRPPPLLLTGPVGTVANRRVSGVKFNGGAWAILEEQGKESAVVKPGDVIDGTRINSISREAIYITDPEGQKWIVPLRGAGPGSAATPVGASRPGSS